MKRKTRRNVNISPDSLVVGPWARKTTKEEKRNAVISAIIFVICLAIVIVLEKTDFVVESSAIGIFVLILIAMLFVSFVAAIAPIAEFLCNQFLRMIHNEEARQEMRAREEREKQEMLAEEAEEWAD